MNVELLVKYRRDDDSPKSEQESQGQTKRDCAKARTQQSMRLEEKTSLLFGKYKWSQC